MAAEAEATAADIGYSALIHVIVLLMRRYATVDADMQSTRWLMQGSIHGSFNGLVDASVNASVYSAVEAEV